MHIPDGYLSPSTCAAFYAASTPFWYIALRRVKRVLATRTVPLLSVFSAFSFVVMMFNLPLPGGTTGHAVGMGMASIVLGPWISLLAISTALLIQALLFGDGGVTAYGANCFNMAIVGSLAAYAVYRLIALRASLTAVRRVVAAGLAGYIAINLAALCASIEFGLQPILFHNASGVPLYAPYALHIAIPAMMIGHLTFAGLAELVLSAGLVAYLQRADPLLLRKTAPDAPDAEEMARTPAHFATAWPSPRRLWLIVAAFLVLTPLGILAAGTAWGEWRAADFGDAAARAAIARTSGHQLPPRTAPAGLARLSSFWTAPVSNYAPSFVRSASFGYFISGAIGVGVIIFALSFASWIISRFRAPSRIRRGFVERTIDSLMRLSQEALYAETIARSSGLLQRLDPRVKLAGLGALVLAVIAIHRLWLLWVLFVFGILLTWVSRIPLTVVAGRVWLAVLGFTGLIALPALFLIPGQPAASLPIIDWAVTWQGLTAAEFLVLRAETAATLVFVVILTTSWYRLLRALRLFGIPAALVIILEMTYRYIFVFLRAASQLFESRRARLLGSIDPAQQRSSASAIAGVLLHKSLSLSDDVHQAMQARGFRGDIRLLDDLSMSRADWLKLAGLLLLATATIWIGR
jgi:cobalt/nickel transport system permease protein